MFLSHLRLHRFRNHFETALETKGAQVVLLRGPNGAGKSGILESIHLAASGVGMRTRRDRELMMMGHDNYLVGFTLMNSRKYAVKYSSENGRESFDEGVRFAKWTDIIGRLKMTCLKPDDMSLIEEGPAVRRRYLDIMLSQCDRAYFDALRRYKRALKQMNRAGGFDSRIAGSFERMLRDEMPYLFQKRAWAVRELHAAASGMSAALGLNIALEYRPAIPSAHAAPEWRTIAAECLRENTVLEQSGVFHRYGPARDELAVTFNGLSLRQYGSQGQKRLAALLLRVAEARLLSSEDPAVILVDDVFGELDERSRVFIFELLDAQKNQLWIASTDTSECERFWATWIRFDVRNGSVAVPPELRNH